MGQLFSTFSERFIYNDPERILSKLAASAQWILMHPQHIPTPSPKRFVQQICSPVVLYNESCYAPSGDSTVLLTWNGRTHLTSISLGARLCVAPPLLSVSWHNRRRWSVIYVSAAFRRTLLFGKPLTPLCPFLQLPFFPVLGLKSRL